MKWSRADQDDDFKDIIFYRMFPTSGVPTVNIIRTVNVFDDHCLIGMNCWLSFSTLYSGTDPTLEWSCVHSFLPLIFNKCDTSEANVDGSENPKRGLQDFFGHSQDVVQFCAEDNRKIPA